MHERLARLSRAQKVLLSLATVGVAAALAGAGTWATFTSSATANQSVSSGTVVIALGTTGTSANRLTVNATDVAPGDTIQRAVDLSNTGSLSLSGVALTTVATTSSLLDTDATNGLQMVVDRCSVAWTEAGTAPAYTYTCSGTTSSVVASRPVVGSNLAMSNLTATAPGATDHLRVTLSLPTTADNTFQGKSSTISYTFTATQRAGTNR
ncbi:MAG TPA: TasA family protein [Acidimicrobiales bacterium]|jgi:predicted ribosomally synthesized peptide with SipW-like signal peptide